MTARPWNNHRKFDRLVYLAVVLFIRIAWVFWTTPKNLSLPLDQENANRELAAQVLHLPDDLHFCRLPTPAYGMPKITIIDESPIMSKLQALLMYQCNGQPYEDFMNHLFQFVSSKFEENGSLMWGRRSSIMPGKNKHILIVGNSHTRQMLLSTLCMYSDNILSTEDITIGDEKGTLAMRYHLVNNNKITAFSNHPFIFSDIWQTNLEKYYLKHSLQQFDAIVLGRFNRFKSKYRGTELWTNIAKFAEKHPEQKIHFAREINPNNVMNWINTNDGPIVFTNSMDKRGEHLFQNVTKIFQEQSKERKNLRTVNGREHISEIGSEGCITVKSTVVETCVEESNITDYANEHHCRGPLGSSVDLASWDVIESLWDILGNAKE